MNREKLIQLLQCFRSGNEELMTASNELMQFYSTPESLPILTSLYLSTNDVFLKKSILIGIDKALNNENLSNINCEQLTILQNSLILMLTNESDTNLLDNIVSFFPPILKKFKKSWASLDNYLFSNDLSKISQYFYIFINYIPLIKSVEECDEIIKFTGPKLKYIFQKNTSLLDQLSAFCFITDISIKMEHPNFLWEFTEEFKTFFQQACINSSNSILHSFFSILKYIEKGTETSKFTKSVCNLKDIIIYCLSPNSNYTNCIHMRLFINKSLIVSELEMNDLLVLITNLIQLSKKLYSKEIDLQTQQIDNYFPVLKYIPINQRREFCILHIQSLIQENTPASICTALDLFRGAIISGVIFGENDLEFFMKCYNLNHLGVKMIAASTLIDIAEEISSDIEQNIDLLINAFCQDLDSSFALPILSREPFALSIFEVIQTVLLFCNDFSDKICENLLKSILIYFQNGSQIEQYQALLTLSQIIRHSPKVALLPDIYNLVFQLLLSNNSNFKEIVYSILEIYVELYPNNTNINAILEKISNEPPDECFNYVTVLGYIAYELRLDERVKQFILGKVPLILALCEQNDNTSIQNGDNRGRAIFSLFCIMTAYNETINTLFLSVMNSIANLIQTKGTNETNIKLITKGVEFFSMISDSYRFNPGIFSQIFIQIKSRLEREFDTDDNLFEILYLLTNFIECNKFPEIDIFVFLAIRRFVELMKSDEKKDIKGIQITSNFVRTVFTNYNSPPMNKMGNQLIDVILNQFAKEKSSSVLEGHLMLILASISATQIDTINYYRDRLISFLVPKIMTSNSNTVKNIAYFFKNLANRNAILVFCNNNKENLEIIWNSLVSRLSQPESSTPTLLLMNDNIISAMISIEENIHLLPINNFYALISPFLPCYTDSDEFLDIYSSLISFFPRLNDENKNHFINVLILFLSFTESTSFFSAVSDSERTDLLVFMFTIIKGKLDSIDDAKSFIDSIIKDDDHKNIFTHNFNYIGSIVQQLSRPNTNTLEKTN